MKKRYKALLITTEIIIGGCIALAGVAFYFQFLRGLPEIDLKDFQTLPQASIITDSKGNELYRFYDENRRHAEYKNISDHMINAIVATEDKSFWENKGVERISIIRATIHNIKIALGQKTQIQGASTITQQLVKNHLLTREKTITRKVKEIILAQRLTKKREKQIQKNTYNNENTHEKTKQQILETYLNDVYYGNRSYGITAAANNYFHTKPSHLTALQSAILASLPQAPSSYNPIKNPTRVMGNRIIQNTEEHILPHQQGTHKENITQALLTKKLTITQKKECVSDVKKRASNIQSNNSILQYEPGRKDRALCRMFEDGYITQGELISNIIATKDLAIYQATDTIKSPHFVFWVERFLEQSPIFQKYGIHEANISRAGRTIQTSLNPLDQKIASESVQNNMKHVHKNGGNNRALVHVDSSNGDVRAYIGSADYHNNEIKGKNDMIQATRQVGSTIKPLIYAYFFTEFGKTTNMPIWDMKLPPEYAKRKQPKNSDAKYRGKISMKTALASSRNVPTIKLFYVLGRERNLVPYLQTLGFKNLKEDRAYGYSLSLGAGEGSMIELANSYIGLSSDDPTHIAQINPIISITDNKGKVIYQKETDKQYRTPRIIPLTVSYMIRETLSNLKNAPQDRYYYLVIPSIEQGTYALKTGTSEKKYGNRGFPNDARIASYTNRDIIISRAGHTDGKALGKEGYGLFLNHRIIKDYYRELKENQLLIGGKKTVPQGYQGYYPPAKNNKLEDRQKRLLFK